VNNAELGELSKQRVLLVRFWLDIVRVSIRIEGAQLLGWIGKFIEIQVERPWL